MADLDTMMTDFLTAQAESGAATDRKLAALKTAILPLLKSSGVQNVEIRFEGYGDEGAVEEIVCLDATGTMMACPEINVAIEGRDEMTLKDALEDLAYGALERNHPGWEDNDGANGQLIIDMEKDTVSLDCNLRYMSYDSRWTDL